MYTSREKGNLGEEIASDYLIRNGYTILERNFMTRFGEIDIIAREGSYFSFIEVKARKDFSMGLPCEAVDKFKQRKIVRMAYLYISQKKLFNENFRFDIVELVLNSEGIKYIRLIKDAFQTD